MMMTAAAGILMFVMSMIMSVDMIISVIMLMMVPVIGMAMVRHRAVGMHHSSIRQMGVIMVVAIDCQSLGSRPAEEAHIFRTLAHGLRRAAAANMAIQANDSIGLRHHYM